MKWNSHRFKFRLSSASRAFEASITGRTYPPRIISKKQRNESNSNSMAYQIIQLTTSLTNLNQMDTSLVSIKNILKPSNLGNLRPAKHSLSKEEHLRQWEDQLRKREYQLELKKQHLKNLSKEIKMQSESLVRQKLELQEKLEKYTKVLEQIIQNQPQSNSNGFTERMFKSSSFNLLSCKNRSLRSNKESIVDCSNRVANLLNTIRSTSNFNKTPQHSYMAQNQEYEEILFSKRHPPSNLSQIVQTEGVYSKRDENTSVENHVEDMQKIEREQKAFYQKVFEEMNRLKKPQLYQ